MDLSLRIKLDLDYEILNLGLMEFILICHILNFGELILNLGSFVVNKICWMYLNYLIWT